MPEFSTEEQTKIAALRALYLAGTATEPYELAKISWPAPDSAIWYSTSIPSEITAALPVEVAPLQVRLLADSLPDSFLPIKQGEEIGDETVDLKFWDGPDDAGENNGAFGDLLFTHGEGVKIELFYWFPQVELLLRVWQGHLRTEADADPPYLPIKAAQGFRSSEALLPSGGHYEYCSAIFGGILDTQEEIDENGCPYNLHIGGGVGNTDPDTGLPWTFCNRLDHQSCIDRAVNPLFHLSHNTIQTTVRNSQTKGNTLYSTTQGNQTNLPDPVCVVMGTRRITGELLAYARDLNNNHPDKGWFRTLNELARGPIQSISQWGVTINGTRLSDPAHYRYRLGNFGQTATYDLTTTHGFSNIANFAYTYGQIDPSTVNPSDVSSDAVVAGLNNIRVYSDEDTFSEIYTTNRVWQIARMLCDKIWGFGLDYAKFNIPVWIEAAQWVDDYVRFADLNGDLWDHQRSSSNVELRGKKVQQQIEDMCRAGRLSRPFLHNGKICIVPLRKLTAEELAAVPVFTDQGDAPNIVHEKRDGVERTTLRMGRKSSLDLPNRIEITYDKAADDWKETPLRPIEDIEAQLAAGRAEGTTSRKTEPKRYNSLGATDEAQNMKLAQAFLDLGEFDEGGLANNCHASFSTWYVDALDLHLAKVVKIENTNMQDRYGFQYFRVKTMEREPDLKVKLTFQAYNPDYMDTFEVLLSDIIDNPGDYPYPPPDDPTPLPPSNPSPDPAPMPPRNLPGPIIAFDSGMLSVL